tara:strand:- start:1931 stop:2686 length:756 start_codon:yes stop_codon:yes gene_type:complete
MTTNIQYQIAKNDINNIKKFIKNNFKSINNKILPIIKKQQEDISQLVLPIYVEKLKDLPYVFFAEFFENLEAIWPEIDISKYENILTLVESILYNMNIMTIKLVVTTNIDILDRFIYLLLTKKYFENVRKLLKKIYSYKGKLSTVQLQLFEKMTKNKFYYSMIPYFIFFDLDDYELNPKHQFFRPNLNNVTYKKYFGNHDNFQQFKMREESDVDYFEYAISGQQKNLNIGFGILGTIIVGLGVLVIKLSKN